MKKRLCEEIHCFSYCGEGTVIPPVDFAGCFGILYITEGAPDIYLGAEKLTASPGTFVTVADGSVLYVRSEQHAEMDLLAFPTVMLTENMQTVDRELFDIFMLQARLHPYIIDDCDHVYSQLYTVFEECVTEYITRSTCYRLSLRAHICCFTSALLRYYSEAKRDGDKVLYHNVARLGAVVSYVESNLGKKVSVPELSSMLHLSANYFTHLMYEATGKTAVHYLHSVRLNSAMRFIISTDMSISEISRAVGYNGAGYFTRLFSSHMELSPTEYRDMCISE